MLGNFFRRSTDQKESVIKNSTFLPRLNRSKTLKSTILPLAEAKMIF